MTAETHIPASHEALPFHQDPTFWVAIAIVLFVVLAFKSLRRIFLQKTGDYADNVAKQLNEAKALRIEAENLITQYRQRQKEAVKEAERIVETAKQDARAMQENALADLQTALRVREKSALEKIARAEAEVIKDLRLKTAELATATAEDIIRQTLDATRTAALIDQAIREMPKQVH